MANQKAAHLLGYVAVESDWTTRSKKCNPVSQATCVFVDACMCLDLFAYLLMFLLICSFIYLVMHAIRVFRRRARDAPSQFFESGACRGVPSLMNALEPEANGKPRASSWLIRRVSLGVGNIRRGRVSSGANLWLFMPSSFLTRK